eukprot:11277744-Alexandrium_andersonii.AAC.1
MATKSPRRPAPRPRRTQALSVRCRRAARSGSAGAPIAAPRRRAAPTSAASASSRVALLHRRPAPRTDACRRV